MDTQERYYTLAKVLSGRTYCEGCFVNHPNRMEFFEVEVLHHEIMKEARLSGLFLQSEIYDLLEKFGMWSDGEDERLKQLEEHLDNYRVAMFENILNSRTREAVRKELRGAEKEIYGLRVKKHQWDQFTADAVANFVKFEYLIIQNITDRDGNSVYNDDLANERIPFINEIITAYHQDQPSEDLLRELARTEPWRNQWSVGGSVYETFGKPSLELTNTQTALCLWSKFYDNVGQSSDAPHESVVQDDDLLDGWLVVQKRKRESEANKKEVESRVKNKKISQSSEIFLVAETAEDARKIHDANDTLSRMKIRSRNKTIKAKGVASQLDFSDVRLELEQKLQEAKKR